MATITKRMTKSGPSYRIQVKMKDKGSGKLNVYSTTWRPPAGLTQSLLPLERNACLPGCVWNATPRSLSPLERNTGFWTQANVPLQGRQGSRGCIPDAPGETGIHLEWKQRTPLCSRVATGISGSSLGGLKGVKPRVFADLHFQCVQMGHEDLFP